MTALIKKWLAPPYSQLTGLVSAIVAVAAEFTEPASAPALVALLGPSWTKQIVAACVLVVLVSKALERQQKPTGPQKVEP